MPEPPAAESHELFPPPPPPPVPSLPADALIYVAGVVNQIDTTNLFAQFTDAFQGIFD